MNALFSTVGEPERVVDSAGWIRQFYLEHPGVLRCYPFMAMKFKKRNTTGIGMVGGKVRRDGKQTTMSFFDHRFALPPADMDEVRKALRERAFEALCGAMAEEFTDRQVQIQESEDRLLRLRFQLKRLRAESRLLENLVGAGAEEKLRKEREFEKRIEAAEKEPEDARTGFAELNGHLERVMEMMECPERHLDCESTTVRLDRMNILHGASSGGQRKEMQFVCSLSLGRPVNVVSLVCLPREETLPLWQ